MHWNFSFIYNLQFTIYAHLYYVHNLQFHYQRTFSVYNLEEQN